MIRNNIISINESQLNRIVRESVHKVVREQQNLDTLYESNKFTRGLAAAALGASLGFGLPSCKLDNVVHQDVVYLNTNDAVDYLYAGGGGGWNTWVSNNDAKSTWVFDKQGVTIKLLGTQGEYDSYYFKNGYLCLDSYWMSEPAMYKIIDMDRNVLTLQEDLKNGQAPRQITLVRKVKK